MKASEAKEMTKETTLEDLLKQIKNLAESGSTALWNPPFINIKDETKLKLISLGYSVKQQQDHMGTECVIVSWF